jgi:hypothetical protein
MFQDSNIICTLASAVTFRKSLCPTPYQYNLWLLTALLTNKSRDFLSLLQHFFHCFYLVSEMSVTFTILTMCDIKKHTEDSESRMSEM